MALLFLVILSLSIIGCKPIKKEENSSTISISSEKVLIKNQSNQSALFELIIGPENFLLTKEQILSDIKLLAIEKNISSYMAAWLYVVRYTTHSEPVTSENWIHDPIIFLNSIGEGFCDDRASSLAIIWQWLEFETRVWELNGHVVPEVKINNTWHMLDPDYEVFYLNQNNQIASVNELELNTQLISNTKQIHPIIQELQLLNNEEQNEAKYIRKLIDIYSSQENNYLLDWFTEVLEENHDQTFYIPGNSKIVFPYIYNETKNKALKLTLYNSKTHSIKIPLALIEVRGDEEINTNDSISTKNSQMMDLDYNLYNENVTIKMTTDSVELYYSLNPKLFERGIDLSDLKLVGEKTDSIIISIH